MNAKPRAFMCYLCGTQHFSSSLLIHIPQCYVSVPLQLKSIQLVHCTHAPLCIKFKPWRPW